MSLFEAIFWVFVISKEITNKSWLAFTAISVTTLINWDNSGCVLKVFE
jgi:hypothetical protein